MPTIYNVEPIAYEKYKNTPRKSVFVVLIMALIFCYYALTPILIDSLVGKSKYSVAIKIADLYSKVIPISPDVYAQRAYASYKLGKYKDAVKDFQLANSYSLSNSFDFDILGVKTCYLPFEEALQEFDNTISQEKDVLDKQFLQSEKANYLLKNKRYIDAIEIYDSLILEYKTKSDVGFVPEMVYFNRGYAKSEIGDIYGSELDIDIAKKMFNDCKLDVETKLVRLP